MATDKKKSLGERLKFLTSATAIGVYITVIFAVTAFSYYQARQNPSELKGALKILHDVDQKSIDYRLIMRGQRAADPNVAVLAVDDRSIDLIGRWPWPRETIAKLMKAALDGGAKVIATDMVWSEPTDRPEVRFASELGTKLALSGKTISDINQILENADSDKTFAEFVKEYQSKIVLGNFYEGEERISDNQMPPKAAPCLDMAYKHSMLDKIVESQEHPFIISDDRELNIEPKLADVYLNGIFPDIEAEVKASRPAPTSLAESVQLQKDILMAKLVFCGNRFLNVSGKNTDEAAVNLAEGWSTIAPEIFGENVPAASYEEWIKGIEERTLKNAVPETRDWTLNIPSIALSGTNHGYFNAKLDQDGTIRRSLLAVRTGSRYMPSIALQAFLLATNSTAEIEISELQKIPGARGITKFKINNSEGEAVATIPTDTEGYLMINYAGRRHSIPHASAADLLNENKKTISVKTNVRGPNGKYVDETREVPKAEFLKDKIFVLGATAIAVFDLRVSPFDENFPGVETHANTIDNLLRKDFLFHSNEEDLQMPAVMLALGIALSASISYSGALVGLLLTLATFIGIGAFDQYALFANGIVVSVAFPLFQTLFTYSSLTFYKYLTEERSKKELRQTFSKYVSPQIVEEILRDPKNLELGGRKENITVFFSDVRGFTTFSEKLDPKDLSDLLNSYLTPMTDLVFLNRGTLDKYMGDAIMAFFGAPVPMPDHAAMAARCALQHMERLTTLNQELAKRNMDPIDIGIGLNTGECSVGNMGSQTVRNYTVMGDPVNLASRLEGINKEYGTHIIISEFTYAEIKDTFTCREVDWVRVKGKNKPVRIFELICEGAPSKERALSIEYFNSGYQKYHKADFPGAIADFKKAVEMYEGDETSRIYIERCQDLVNEPPPENWDGVFVMKTK